MDCKCSILEERKKQKKNPHCLFSKFYMYTNISIFPFVFCLFLGCFTASGFFLTLTFSARCIKKTQTWETTLKHSTTSSCFATPRAVRTFSVQESKYPQTQMISRMLAQCSLTNSRLTLHGKSLQMGFVRFQD